MKTKLFLFLLIISLNLNICGANKKRKPQYRTISTTERSMTRSSLIPSCLIEETNNNSILLTFQFSLNNTDIIIKDCNGNNIDSEQGTFIYYGKTVSIENTDSYPYFIEITSPTIDILGKIILEE